MKKTIGNDVRIIEYSKEIDFLNCITHAFGALMSVFAFCAAIKKAEGNLATFSAAVYGLSLITVYTASAVYHGLKSGEKKRIARITDHCAVPLLIAGTATPCALVSLYEISNYRGIAVFALGWLCALFGIFSKVFFFEKLKSITMAVYIVSGTIMLLNGVPVLDQVDKGAFVMLVIGGLIYVAGAVLCGMGARKPFLHVVFHLFVMVASAVHFYSIYTYVL